jgi:hypothetical protein
MSKDIFGIETPPIENELHLNDFITYPVIHQNRNAAKRIKKRWFRLTYYYMIPFILIFSLFLNFLTLCYFTFQTIILVLQHSSMNEYPTFLKYSIFDFLSDRFHIVKFLHNN